MKHLGTCQLQTRRLDLRKFKISDADMVYHNWTSDPEVARYVAWPVHQNVNTTKRKIQISEKIVPANSHEYFIEKAHYKFDQVEIHSEPQCLVANYPFISSWGKVGLVYWFIWTM